MKALLKVLVVKVLVAGLVSMVLFSGSAKACGNRCQVNPNVQTVPQNIPQLNQVPQPIPNPPTPGNGLSLNDTVLNDLPADAKRAIKAAAAKARPNVQVRQVSNSRSNATSINRNVR